MKRDLTKKAETCFPVGGKTSRKQNDSLQRTFQKGTQKLEVSLKLLFRMTLKTRLLECLYKEDLEPHIPSPIPWHTVGRIYSGVVEQAISGFKDTRSN